MKNNILKQLVIVGLMTASIGNVVEAAVTELPSGTTVVTNVQNKVDVAGDVLHAGSTVDYTSNGNINANTEDLAAKNGASIVFDTGSKVTIETTGGNHRSFYLTGNSTGSLSGELNITSTTGGTGPLKAGTRVLHIDGGSTANFNVGSETNVTSSGMNSYAVVLTMNSKVNLQGTMTVDQNNNYSAVSIGVNEQVMDTHGVNVFTVGSTGVLNATTGATNERGHAIALYSYKGTNRQTFNVEQGGKVVAKVLNPNSEGYGLYVASQNVADIKGDLTIDAKNKNALKQEGSNAVTNIDGTNANIKIDGNIDNVSGNANSKLNITLAQSGSSLTGDHTLTDGGSSNFTFKNDTTWTGNNNMKGTNTTTIKFEDDAKFIGDNNVVSGLNSMTFATNSTFTGNSLVTGGQNTITMNNNSSITGGTIEVTGGRNTMFVNDKAEVHNKLQGTSGFMTATFNNDAQLLAANEVGNATTNLTFNDNSQWTKDNEVKGTAADFTANFNNAAKWTGNNAVSHGTSNITLSATSTWGEHGSKVQNNVTGDGKNTITLNGTAGNAWYGDSTVNGQAAENTINLSGDHSYWQGNSTTKDGKNTINISDSALMVGKSTIEGGINKINVADTGKIEGDIELIKDGTNDIVMTGGTIEGSVLVHKSTNTITMSGNALLMNGTVEVDDADATNIMEIAGQATVANTLINSAGTLTGSFSGSSSLSADNEISGGTTTLTFGDTSTWHKNNNVTGGTNSITFSGTTGNLWQGDSTVNGTGAVNNITLSGNGARWEGDSNVLDGKHTGSFSGQSSWAGNSLVNGANAVSENSFSERAGWRGDNTVEEGSSTLDFTDNAFWNGDNIVKGGTHEGNFAGETAWGGNNITTGGTNTTNIKDESTWSGDNLFSGGTSKLILDNNATWLGNNAATATGTNEVVLKGSADWEGMSNDSSPGKSSVSIEDSGTWFMHGNSTVTNLNVQDQGTVDMASNVDGSPKLNNYETLTVNNLTGNGGSFIFDTDLNKAVLGSETTDSDKLVVNGTSTGTHYVQVSDASLYTGTDVTGTRKLLLITDLSQGNYEFVGKALNQGGLWQVNPPNFFQEGNKWYLEIISKEPNPDTTVSILDRHTVYNQWTRINNDTLRRRLGDLRYNASDAGVWARYYNGRLSGTGYEQSYNTMQIGLDKTRGNMTYGLAVDRQNSNRTYSHGNGEGTNINASLYATQYTDTGSYWDLIAKYGKINSKYTTNGPFVDKADYSSNGYSLSSEYGKTNRYAKGYFVEPKVQLTYGYVAGVNYATERKTNIEEAGIKSFMSRVGVVAGRKINKDSDYYVKLSYLREFFGKRSVFMSAANGEKMPYSENYADAWFEIGIGGNVQIARKTHVYGDVERSLGADIEKKWQVNAGVRWEF